MVLNIWLGKQLECSIPPISLEAAVHPGWSYTRIEARSYKFRQAAGEYEGRRMGRYLAAVEYRFGRSIYEHIGYRYLAGSVPPLKDI